MSNLQYRLPEGDFCKYLVGTWKRNLEWRTFGGSFQHLRVTNNVVVIEEDENAAVPTGTKFLKWYYGHHFDKKELTCAYTIQFTKDEKGTFMEWSFEGSICYGLFKDDINVAIFNFCLEKSMVAITYRVIDQNTMAVSIVDVDSEHTPSIVYGNMYRIDPDHYLDTNLEIEKEGRGMFG